MMPSLCESCRNLREVRTARSRFLLCELSVTNADYPKYPPQAGGRAVRWVSTEGRNDGTQGRSTT